MESNNRRRCTEYVHHDRKAEARADGLEISKMAG